MNLVGMFRHFLENVFHFNVIVISMNGYCSFGFYDSILGSEVFCLLGSFEILLLESVETESIEVTFCYRVIFCWLTVIISPLDRRESACSVLAMAIFRHYSK